MIIGPLRSGFFITLLLAGLAGCGSPGIPHPPSLKLPQSVTDLRAERKGDRVFLSWTAPVRTTDSQLISEAGIARICRTLNTPPTDCQSSPGRTASPQPDEKAPRPPKASFTDSLQPSDFSNDPAAQLFYAVSVYNENGRTAGLSNIVSVPAVGSPPPPSNFTAQVTAQGVELSWSGTQNAASISNVEHFYRVYRSQDGSNDKVIAGELAVDSTPPLQVIDHSFDWEKTYNYWGTIVTRIHVGGSERSFEGDDTPAVKIFAHDVFPPAVPTGLQAVYSGVGQARFIDLIWGPDTDADLAGYNVYRKEGSSAPVKINVEVVKVPAYRDTAVQAGHTYTYTVTATDVRGNESARSAEASESVP
jgi:hypothetical protein